MHFRRHVVVTVRASAATDSRQHGNEEAPSDATGCRGEKKKQKKKKKEEEEGKKQPRHDQDKSSSVLTIEIAG